MRITVFFVIFIVAGSAFGQSRQTFELFENGMAASRSGDHQQALGKFEQTLVRGRHENAGRKFLTKVHYNLGVSRFHLGQLEQAVVDFETAIFFTNNRYEKASYALGLTLSELGDYPKAERAFLDVLAVNKQNAEAWFDLAFIHLNRKEYDSAEAAFAKAIRFGTVDNAIGHNNLGVLLVIKGDLPAAERHFRKAITSSSGTFEGAVMNLERCRNIINGREKLLAIADFTFTRGRSKNI
jgi:tetratricopeptide (TPR) repeat protein